MMAIITNKINNINDDNILDLCLRLVAIILLTAIVAVYLIVTNVNLNVYNAQENIMNTVNVMEVF